MGTTEHRLLLGTYAPTVSLVSFTPPQDGKAGSVSVVKELPIANASWIIRHPVHKDIFYTCIEEFDGGGTVLGIEGSVAVFRIDTDGKYEKLGQVSAVDNPCHIAVLENGKSLVVANYTGGSALLYPLNEDGTFVKSGATNYVKFPQLADKPPRAHQCIEIPSLGECWVSDTGNHCLWRLKLSNKDGLPSWDLTGHHKLMDGGGPRQAVVTPDARHVYALQSRVCCVTHHDLSKPSGEQMISSHSVLPPPHVFDPANRPGPPFTSCAALNYHAPSSTLLATTRMVQNEPVDSIAWLKVASDGSLTPGGIIRPARGKEYRGVGLVGDNYIFAGQTDGWLDCLQWDGTSWVERKLDAPKFTKVVDFELM